MMTGWRLLVAAIVVSVVQVGFLGWMIAGRAAILQNGTEILLETRPVDPRDLLRGDYVRLGYSISSIPIKEISDVNGATETTGQPIYVLLKKQANGYWERQAASFAKPVASSPGEVVIRGAVPAGSYLSPDYNLDIDYGIERFYVPEGEGREIEKDMRERNFGILAAVDDEGTAQIKALMDGGVKLYEEPIY